MKRFLTTHFNLEDDLRRAALNAEKAGDGQSAGTLLYYADEIKKYRPERLYLCDAKRNSISGLRVWQKNTLRIAEQFDRCLFTRQEVEDLVKRLGEFSATQKNVTEEIRGPKWEDEERFGLCPYINIGYNCSISFIPVKGDYKYA